MRQQHHRIGERPPLLSVGLDTFGEELTRMSDQLARARDLFDRLRECPRAFGDRDLGAVRLGAAGGVGLRVRFGFARRLARHPRFDARDQVRQLGPAVEVFGEGRRRA